MGSKPSKPIDPEVKIGPIRAVMGSALENLPGAAPIENTTTTVSPHNVNVEFNNTFDSNQPDESNPLSTIPEVSEEQEETMTERLENEIGTVARKIE